MRPQDKKLADAIFGAGCDADAIGFAAIYLTELLIQQSVSKEAAIKALLEIALAIESDIEQIYDGVSEKPNHVLH